MTNDKLAKIISALMVMSLLFLLATLAFPYSTAQQVALIATGSFFVLEYIASRRWSQWQWTNDKWIYVLCIAFFLLTPVWQLWDPEPVGTFYRTTMEHQLPFLLIGVLGILGCFPVIRLRWVAMVMLLTIIGMFVYVVCHLDPQYYTWSYDAWFYYNYARNQYVNAHMTIDLYANVALVLGLFVTADRDEKTGVRILMGLLCVLVIFIQLLSNGRVGVATTLLVAVVMPVYWLWKNNRVIALAAAVLLIAGSVMVITHTDRMKSEQIKNDPRVTIWQFSWEQIKQRPCLGYGVSSYGKLFVERANGDERMQQFFFPVLEDERFAHLEKNINLVHPHNAFLALWLEHGLTGPLLFAAILLMACVVVPKEKRTAMLLFIAAVTLQAVMEPLGQHLQAMFIMLLLFLIHYSSVPQTSSISPRRNW